MACSTGRSPAGEGAGDLAASGRNIGTATGFPQAQRGTFPGAERAKPAGDPATSHRLAHSVLTPTHLAHVFGLKPQPGSRRHLRLLQQRATLAKLQQAAPAPTSDFSWTRKQPLHCTAGTVLETGYGLDPPCCPCAISPAKPQDQALVIGLPPDLSQQHRWQKQSLHWFQQLHAPAGTSSPHTAPAHEELRATLGSRSARNAARACSVLPPVQGTASAGRRQWFQGAPRSVPDVLQGSRDPHSATRPLQGLDSVQATAPQELRRGASPPQGRQFMTPDRLPWTAPQTFPAAPRLATVSSCFATDSAWRRAADLRADPPAWTAFQGSPSQGRQSCLGPASQHD